MNWQRIKCAVFGHAWQVEGDQGDIGAERNCSCGAHWPAVVWPRMPEPTRPAPPMPACKPPRKS